MNVVWLLKLCFEGIFCFGMDFKKQKSFWQIILDVIIMVLHVIPKQSFYRNYNESFSDRNSKQFFTTRVV